MIDADPWLGVQTRVNAEARAARNLLQQGFEIYLPRYLHHHFRAICSCESNGDAAVALHAIDVSRREPRA
jgi:hypothetical protein